MDNDCHTVFLVVNLNCKLNIQTRWRQKFYFEELCFFKKEFVIDIFFTPLLPLRGIEGTKKGRSMKFFIFFVFFRIFESSWWNSFLPEIPNECWNDGFFDLSKMYYQYLITNNHDTLMAIISYNYLDMPDFLKKLHGNVRPKPICCTKNIRMWEKIFFNLFKLNMKTIFLMTCNITFML